MSQRQKQVTNEKRARRLGTGEGIARDRRSSSSSGGGIPGWVWIAVLVVAVAAIAVGVGIAVAGGGSSSSSSTKGQDSKVVQDRLSTEKIDFTSQGTWKPVYENLAGAITALGLPAASDFTEHYHAHVHLIVEGHDVPVPAQIGIDQATQTLSPIHTHDERGVIHVEADQKDFRGTLLQTFDIWGLKLTDECVGGYCNGVKAWNKGKSIDLATYQLQPHDAITILEGTPPAGFKPDASFTFASGE